MIRRVGLVVVASLIEYSSPLRPTGKFREIRCQFILFDSKN
jgi:hypothetical protein